MERHAINPTREEDYAEWYQQVVKAGDLAEHAPVRGCMIMRPWGYGLWEHIQHILDRRLKDTGHQNAYFPLFIPLSLLEKEASHVDGFAKECAVVTHHRLEKNSEGRLVPTGELEEPLIVRPTSETIIGEMFAKWITSYRDLPVLINQWANVVRWEMRTRLFLRTTEFLWQEGHTAHATEKEAREETMLILQLYADFAKDILALPVVVGEKTETERFPGAVATYTIECMMQDRKALQAGTSHFLGQNFAKAAGVQFQDEQGALQHAWTTSWGVTTRLIGALIMTHGDDDGVVLPPRVATKQVVIIPVVHKEEHRKDVLAHCHQLKQSLSATLYHESPIEVICDDRDMRGGDKIWNWIRKGVPIRIEIGPRDIAAGTVCLFRRDRSHKEMTRIAIQACCEEIPKILDLIQAALYERALAFRIQHTHRIDDRDTFYHFFAQEAENMKIHGGFALCHWSAEAEEIVKRDLNVTIRCVPLDEEEEEGKCIITGKPSKKRALFAKSY